MPNSARPPRDGAATRAAVANRLHSAAIHLLRLVRRTDQVTGLTPARLSALSVLVFGGPTTLGELAEAEQVSAPTMSRLVTALHDDGLVQRTGDPADRRVVRIAATPEGARLLLQARRDRVEFLTDRLRALDGDSVDLLGRAADLIDRIAP